jgi:putative FmdB family regulatory protein
MPIYEYQCRECGRTFETLVTGSTRAACPGCRSERLERKLSVFAVGATPSKPASGSFPQPCGTCGDPRGAGACSID